MREPPGPCGAGRLRCVCWAGPLCVPVAAARRVACCPDRFPAAAWPVVLGLAAVCAGGRRPAREIATREPGGSEWSISRPALALPPPTGTAAWPRRPRGGLQSGGAHCLCVVGQAPPPPTGTAAWPCCRPPAPRPGPAGPAAASNRAVLTVCALSARPRHRPPAPRPGPAAAHQFRMQFPHDSFKP